MPLVPGARATTEESILNAYTGDTIEAKREQGEDYWVDPDLVQTEQSREAKKKTHCLICGLSRDIFDEHGNTFDRRTKLAPALGMI